MKEQQNFITKNLQEAEYNLGFLPTVVAKDGYTFKGWKVTNKAGEEILQP